MLVLMLYSGERGVAQTADWQRLVRNTLYSYCWSTNQYISQTFSLPKVQFSLHHHIKSHTHTSNFHCPTQGSKRYFPSHSLPLARIICVGLARQTHFLARRRMTFSKQKHEDRILFIPINWRTRKTRRRRAASRHQWLRY